MKGLRSVDRRRFITWLALGAGAAGVGLATVRASGYVLDPEISSRLRFLRPWQYLVLQAVGARLLHPEAADVALFADSYLADLPQADRRDVRRLIGFVEHGAPLLIGRVSRFTAIDAQAQDGALRAVELSSSGRLRAGFGVLKAVAGMALYSRDDAWSAIGYGGPVVYWGGG